MFSLSASSFVGTSVSASFKGTRDAFVAKGARECFSERGDFYFCFSRVKNESLKAATTLDCGGNL